MVNRITIGYGEFYDFPRQVDFRLGDEWFYLSSAFDLLQDDYADFYDVYLLPCHTQEEFAANPEYWRDLSSAAHLGQIPIADLGFDETRRRSIDGDSFEKWLSGRKTAAGPFNLRWNRPSTARSAS